LRGQPNNMKCEYRNDKHVWVLGGELIEGNNEVECRKTQQCKPDILIAKCEMGPEDSRCFVTANNSTRCTNNKLHVDGQINSISCNIDDGKWKVNGSSDLSADTKLDCGISPSSIAAKLSGCHHAKRKAAKTTRIYRAIFYISLVIIFLLLLANIGIFFGRPLLAKKFKKGNQPGSGITSDLKTAKELEKDLKKGKRIWRNPLKAAYNPVLDKQKKDVEEKSRRANEAENPQQNAENEPKPFRIPPKDIPLKGPLVLRTRYHGEQNHDLEFIPGVVSLDHDVVFDPTLNEAVEIGKGVERYETGDQPNSESKKSTFFPYPEDEARERKEE
ncbi:hypothetical protein PFISCL1PPCAC_11521, partial [Pristionchus fissidentatus]